MLYVLDSYALLVFFQEEKGFEKIKSIFEKCLLDDKLALMTTVNFGEIYYIILRRYGKKKADVIKKIIIQELPIQIIEIDIELALLSGEFKVDKKMSYADCFVAALAKQRKAVIVTGDKEFKEIENKIKIIWI